jgi:hypothetical protein
MVQFARVAITGFHTLGGLNNKNFFSFSCGGWEYQIKVLGGWFLLGLLSLAPR